jgi:RHS repeat-associated protein
MWVTDLDMQYNFSAGQNNGRIVSATDAVSGETVQYQYDAVNRLSNAAGAGWSLAFGYDQYGNMTSEVPSGSAPGLPSFSSNYDANNHQIGATYDGDGNPTSSIYAYNWDVENRALHLNTGYWSYDPSGKRIKQGGLSCTDLTHCSNEIYFYGLSGRKLATFDYSLTNGQLQYWLKNRNLYFGGKMIRAGVTQINGTAPWVTVVTDRLGSVRANSNGETFSYFPYGSERTVSPSDNREKIGTYFRDSDGIDYADQRYYQSAAGRFFTPDPGWRSSMILTVPTSFNRYLYVNGDPINLLDRNGMNEAACGDEDDCDDPNYCDEDYCPDEGGGGGSSGGSSVTTTVTYPCAEGYKGASCEDKLIYGWLGYGDTVLAAVEGQAGIPVNGLFYATAAAPLVTYFLGEVVGAEAAVAILGPGNWARIGGILGATVLNIPKDVWESWSPLEQQGALTGFIDTLVAKGAQIISTANPYLAPAGSGLAIEADYLRTLGFMFVQSGTSWIAVPIP